MPAASLCNALDLPCPLGLRLEKSSSLLDLIQMKLSEGHNTKKDHKASGRVSADKLKASIFSASLLRIGGWEVFAYCFLLDFFFLNNLWNFLSSNFFWGGTV